MNENKKIIDSIPESLKENIELINGFPNSAKTLLQNKELYNLTKNIKMELPQIDDLTDAVKQIQIPLMEFENLFSGYKLRTDDIAAIKSQNNSELREISKIRKDMINNLSDSLQIIIKSPFIEWMRTFDYSPFKIAIEKICSYYDRSKEQEEAHKAYLQIMYECEWFPYAGITMDKTIFKDIIEIVETSRGNSKRRKMRIDRAILAYYTTQKIKAIKKTWYHSDLEPYIKKILGQAINAHLRGEFVLTISCLATMWEGLIKYKTNTAERCGSKKIKEDFKNLVVENDYDLILSDYYNNFIVSQVNKKTDVIDGVPNRNGVSHSKYIKYPNKKASLNAILLTDFIIGLVPKEKTEDIENGQA